MWAVEKHCMVVLWTSPCLSLDALTRNCRRCSSVCSSWWEGVGLRPGGGVTCSHDSSSAGVFSHLDGASSNATHGVSPTTWRGQEESFNRSIYTSRDNLYQPRSTVLSWKASALMLKIWPTGQKEPSVWLLYCTIAPNITPPVVSEGLVATLLPSGPATNQWIIQGESLRPATWLELISRMPVLSN